MSKHALLKNKNKQKYFAGGQDLINQIIDYFFPKFRIFKNHNRNLFKESLNMYNTKS